MDVRRWLFSMRMLLRHQQNLGEYYQRGVPRLCEYPPQQLRAAGVEVLVLDFDGVLASDSEIQPCDEMQSWLQGAVATFGIGQVFILSNNPLPARVQWLAEKQPEIQWVHAERKKPYPDGLEAVYAQTRYRKEQILLADDRLLTGGLSACLAGTNFLYISKPYTQLRKRPATELFFMSLRGLERTTLKVLRWF